jgi:hypothetical protein
MNRRNSLSTLISPPGTNIYSPYKDVKIPLLASIVVTALS